LSHSFVLSPGAAMRRREFLALITGPAIIWPLAARAQRAGKPPVIGLIAPGSAPGSATSTPRTAKILVQRLGELGWVVDRDVVVEYRYAEGSIDRAGEAAAEFARMKVDVILVSGDSEVLAAKRATATIPIVAVAVGDAVGNGVVESLAHPGGNVTGVSLALSETAGKRLELLREVVPGLKRVAIFGNSGNPLVAPERNAAIAGAHALGFDPIISGVQTVEDIAPTIEALKGNADALYVCEDPFTVIQRVRINVATLAARLPTMRLDRISTEQGGLLSYGPDIFDLWRRATELTDKILRGTKPADIPVEQPTKFELVVNLKTAKALGLTVPETFLTRADKVIE
jgi:putative tryptophan/tyrosine transport system substrate-binding protein